MIDLIYAVKEELNRMEDLADLTDDQLRLRINRILIDSMASYDYQLRDIKDISGQVFSRIRGLGALDMLLADDSINEIMVNSKDEIFIESGQGMARSEIRIESDLEYQRIIQKIVSYSGRELNLSKPIVDARLKDGSRVNIVLPPIAEKSPVMTIRKFPKKRIDMDFLLENETLDRETADFLKYLIEKKYNILIGGGTSSGKTSLLNALTDFIPDHERIITIEDSRELRIQRENLVCLETRQANSANKGRVDIKTLIKNSLRMRPDRIIVGEVRSDETIDMLQAMNTGHEGSISTAHANSNRDMVSRIETMILRSPDRIPLEAARRMIGSSLEILVYISKIKQTRKISEISELYFEDEKIKLNVLYKLSDGKLERTENEMRRRK